MRDDSGFTRLLKSLAKERVECFLLRANSPPVVRIGGHEIRLECPPLATNDLRAVLQDVFTESQITWLESNGGEVSSHVRDFPYSCRATSSANGLELAFLRDAPE
jgi:hypothetical protein